MRIYKSLGYLCFTFLSDQHTNSQSHIVQEERLGEMWQDVGRSYVGDQPPLLE